MTRLAELTSQLSPAALRELESYAEFLVTKHRPRALEPVAFINVDGLMGMLPELSPGMTAVELAHEATEDRVRKYAK